MASADPRAERVPGSDSAAPVGSVDADAMLAALEDEDCRRLMRATSETSLTGPELAEQSGIPISTVYRKLERLSELDILSESMRICANGDHATEYRLRIEQITVSITNQGRLQVDISTGE